MTGQLTERKAARNKDKFEFFYSRLFEYVRIGFLFRHI